MKIFYLTETCVELWDHDYVVKAKTLEEAKEKIKSRKGIIKGGLQPYDSTCYESKTKDIIETND